MSNNVGLTDYSPYRLDRSKHSAQNIISKCIGTNKRVLDLGCNRGFLGMLADSSNDFYGVDNSEACIRIARSFYKEASVMDLNHVEALPWDITFDAIVFADVLEHLVDPYLVLKFYFERYLEEGGDVFISLPNIANWRMRLRLMLGRFGYSETGTLDKTHLHFYTYKTARNLVEATGLEVVLEMAGSGSKILGRIIERVPRLRQLLAWNILIIARRR